MGMHFPQEDTPLLLWPQHARRPSRPHLRSPGAFFFPSAKVSLGFHVGKGCATVISSWRREGSLPEIASSRCRSLTASLASINAGGEKTGSFGRNDGLLACHGDMESVLWPAGRQAGRQSLAVQYVAHVFPQAKIWSAQSCSAKGESESLASVKSGERKSVWKRRRGKDLLFSL